jgi:23S rRNA (adenine2030-N6)-methyltransferase
MQYRHRFHAGSFADVHKHVTLLALLAALQRKDGGFLYLETHAGRGSLRPDAPEHRGRRVRRRAALRALQPPPTRHGGAAHYLAQLQLLRAELNNAHAYPGSPLLAARSCARRIVRCCSRSCPARRGRSCARCAATHARARRTGDGFERLRAYLPPPERRSLVFIDPPYEERVDFERVANCGQEALRRLRSAVIVAWYPIKDARTTSAGSRVWRRDRLRQSWSVRMVALSARFAGVTEWLGTADPESALSIRGAHASLARRTARRVQQPGAGGMSIRTLRDRGLSVPAGRASQSRTAPLVGTCRTHV